MNFFGFGFGFGFGTLLAFLSISWFQIIAGFFTIEIFRFTKFVKLHFDNFAQNGFYGLNRISPVFGSTCLHGYLITSLSTVFVYFSWKIHVFQTN